MDKRWLGGRDCPIGHVFLKSTKADGGMVLYIQNLDKHDRRLYNKTEGRDEVDKGSKVLSGILSAGQRAARSALGSLTHVCMC